MNLKKIVSIIAIVAIIGFVFFSCEEDDPGKTSYGETLKLSGQVYNYPEVSETALKAAMGALMAAMMSKDYKAVEKTINDYMFPKTEKFTGSLDIEEQGGTSGKITGGSLNFEMGKPAYLSDIQDYLDELIEDGYTSVDADNKSVQFYLFNDFGVKSSDKYHHLGRGDSSGSKVTIDSKGNVSSNINYDVVVYIYVTDKVKITAKGYDKTSDGMKNIYKDINISLKPGWNVIKLSMEADSKGGNLSAGGSEEFDMSNLMSAGTGTGTSTTSMSLGDADTKWILDFTPYGGGINFGNNGEEENEYE